MLRAISAFIWQFGFEWLIWLSTAQLIMWPYLDALMTYAPPCLQTFPVTLSPRHHDFHRISSCIKVSCLLVAAGASQWPRYNESLWLRFCCLFHQPAVLLLHRQPQVISLSAITAWPSFPWKPVQNGCKGRKGRFTLFDGGFLDRDPWSQRSGVILKHSNNARGRLKIRVTPLTPLLWILTRPSALL